MVAATARRLVDATEHLHEHLLIVAIVTITIGVICSSTMIYVLCVCCKHKRMQQETERRAKQMLADGNIPKTPQQKDFQPFKPKSPSRDKAHTAAANERTPLMTKMTPIKINIPESSDG